MYMLHRLDSEHQDLFIPILENDSLTNNYSTLWNHVKVVINTENAKCVFQNLDLVQLFG